MTWLFFAILAPFVWGYVNVIDTVIRRHYFKNEITLAWLVAVNRLPGFLLLWALFGLEFPSFLPVFIMVLMGALWLTSLLLIFKAYEFESPTRVILMTQPMPVFALGLAFLLLGETLNPLQTIAFALLIAASVLASLRRLEGKFHMSSALLLALFTAVLWAVTNVGYKYAISFFESSWSGMALYFLGAFVAGQSLWIFPRWRTAMTRDLGRLDSSGLYFLASAMLMGLTGSFAFQYALIIGKVSLTTVILGTQPLFVFLFSIFLARFIPRVHEEDTSKTALFFKGIAFVLVILGLYLISIE